MKSRIYPFIAWLFDLYVFSFFLGALVALYETFGPPTDNDGLALALIGFFSSFIFSLIYHIFIAKRVSWLTPGEIGVGRIIQHENKNWSNPYGINRWALFLMIFSALIMAGNSWDRLGLEEFPPYTLMEIIAKVIGLLIVTYGLIQVGRGRIWLGLIFVGFSFLSGLRLLIDSPLPDVGVEELRGIASVFLITGGVQLLVLVVYAFWQDN